jgi:hypothetical protein
MLSGSCGPTIFLENQNFERNRRKPDAKPTGFARIRRRPSNRSEASDRKRRSPEGRRGHPQRRNPQNRRRTAKTTATTGTDLRQSTQKQKTVFKRKAQRQRSSTGDTELYLVAGMLAAVVISVRVFLFRGAGKAN